MDSSAHEAQVWRRAAEAWAKSSAHSWNRANKLPGAPSSSMSMSLPPKSPARNAAQVISDGIQKVFFLSLNSFWLQCFSYLNH